MRDVVDATPGFSTAAEADSGEAAIDAVDQLGARVVLMDRRMPGMGGTAASRVITQRHPNVLVILCSVDDQHADPVHSSGAAAVIRKQDLSPATLQDILASAP